MSSRVLRVLALEPYFGGSHRAFLEGWQSHSRHAWTMLTLPAHKWKWRMRQSSILFGWEIERRFAAGERWDVVFASDMLNLAELLGLQRAPLGDLPAVIYLHENQITYPVRVEKERDLHFGVTNIVSCLAASQVWFNSAFHRDSFVEAIPGLIERMPDHRPLQAAEKIAVRSVVLPPGIHDPGPPGHDPGLGSGEDSSRPLHIVWAARWEHDKDPDTLFDALQLLREKGSSFEISVLGERFRRSPPVFDEAEKRLAPHIRSWGYLEDRNDYEEILRQADVFVSTAQHEFFGLAAVEAMAAGALPLLPARLSYPELLEIETDPAAGRFLYEGGAEVLSSALAKLCDQKASGELKVRGAARPKAERFFWPRAAARLDAALEAVSS
jgi:glycosyltransferase involved in cell wall biosynthesis